METVNKLDVPLLVDISCNECGKLMALSNAIQADNKFYCANCLPIAEQVIVTLLTQKEAILEGMTRALIGYDVESFGKNSNAVIAKKQAEQTARAQIEWLEYLARELL